MQVFKATSGIISNDSIKCYTQHTKIFEHAKGITIFAIEFEMQISSFSKQYVVDSLDEIRELESLSKNEEYMKLAREISSKISHEYSDIFEKWIEISDNPEKNIASFSIFRENDYRSRLTGFENKLLLPIDSYNGCDECIICYRLDDVILYPCGHRNLCKCCFKKLRTETCPLCRADIEEYQLYDYSGEEIIDPVLSEIEKTENEARLKIETEARLFGKGIKIYLYFRMKREFKTLTYHMIEESSVNSS